jgi:hypothetical protein
VRGEGKKGGMGAPACALAFPISLFTEENMRGAGGDMGKQSMRFCFFLAVFLMASQYALAQAETMAEDIVQIRFVDSKGKPIPYFSRLFVYLQETETSGSYKSYLADGGIWDEALPYQDAGGGIGPPRNGEPPYFVDEIDLATESRGDTESFKRFQKAGLPGNVRSVFCFHFPDGQMYLLPFEEAAKLARDQVNVLTVPGDLGSGSWKEIGDFLFKAATQWRTGLGSQSDLINQCDALIKRKQAGDLQWAGNLVFVREHWLQANPRIGNFGREPKVATRKELAELPWGNTRREFASSLFYSYPIEPYRAFKQVLKVNPKDKRASFWTEVLPWVNGIAPEGKRGEPTSADLIRECKRVYMAQREQLDDYHRFWAVKEFMRAAKSATYVERYHLHLKGIHHDADLQWAVDELNSLFSKWPFLRYQIDELGKWLAYMKNPEWIDPLKPER